MHEEVTFVIAGILVGGVLAQWLGWRLRLPAIVFLLAGGLAVGPVFGVLDPDHTFGELLFPSVSIAVAVILFEGALGLGWNGVRAAGRTVWLLLTVGAGITLVGTLLSARFILGISWELAALLATVLVVTGPTVVGPIVRSVGLHGRVGAILEAEGTLIDPIGAILTVLVFQAAFERTVGNSIVVDILLTFSAGTLVGVVAAVVLVILLARFIIPDQLHNVTTLAAVIGAFSVSNAIRAESGLVAVTIMGIALASQQRVPVKRVLEFNETLRTLFISGLFVVLAARIDADTLRQIEWRNIGFLAVLIVVVRPLCVFFSTIGSGLAKRERAFLALTSPRGIVAASVASVFSLRLADLGIANSQILVSATMTVIAGTVLMSGLGSRFFAKRLGILPEVTGTIVILGANTFARELASVLERYNSTVRLIDLDRKQLAAARMTGLVATRGSVLADSTWDAVAIHQASNFLALTNNDELNTLAARHAAAIMGRSQVFQLPPRRPEHETWISLPSGTFARPLFSTESNLTRLNTLLEDGWQITSTHLSSDFGIAEFREKNPGATPLFVARPKQHLEMWPADAAPRCRSGDIVVALTFPVAKVESVEESIPS